MISTKKIANLAPSSQPTSAHEIADRLFPAYKVDGGRVHLAGCRLDNRLFLQVTLRTANDTRRFFLDAAGRRLEESGVAELGLDNTLKLDKPPELAWKEIAWLVKTALRIARDEHVGEFDDVEIEAVDGNVDELGQNASHDGTSSVETEPEATATGTEDLAKFSPAAVWCKFAQGKLCFTIGERSVDLPFSGWAKTLKPPPYVCRYTGVKTFHLAATSDGRIVAAERLETCEASGRRLLNEDLVTCSVSGQRVARDLARVCPVSDEHVQSDRMVQCAACGEMVSPNSMRAERCAACRHMEKLCRDDPRRDRLLGAYPQLARRRGWKIAETASVYILKGGGPLRRILVVVDKDTLSLKRLAVGSCFRAVWNQLDVSRIDEVLQG